MFDSLIAITLAIYLIFAFHSFLLIFSAQLQRGMATALKFKKHNSSQARTQATRTSRSPKAHIALWIRCSRSLTTSFTTQRWTSSPVPTRRARPVSPPSLTTQRWAPSPIARTDRGPFKPASFTTQRWTSSPVPTRRARPGSPPSFTTQRWTSSPTRTRRVRPVSLLVVHMLWASSPVRRLHAMGVVTSSSTSFGHADACCPKEFYLPHELYNNYDVGVVGSGKPRLPPVLARVAGFDYTTFDL